MLSYFLNFMEKGVSTSWGCTLLDRQVCIEEMSQTCCLLKVVHVSLWYLPSTFHSDCFQSDSIFREVIE